MKKDPGVPSSAPFKEEVLREAEQRRLQVSLKIETHLLLMFVHNFVCTLSVCAQYSSLVGLIRCVLFLLRLLSHALSVPFPQIWNLKFYFE